MLQPPPAQLRMVQVAPLAHWIWQCPPVQVSMTQVDPEAQCWMLHPTWQFPTVHLLPAPQVVMLQPPVVHAPRLQVALGPAQAMLQAPPQESIPQVLPSPQAVITQLPPEHSFMWHEAASPLQSASHSPVQPETAQVAPLHPSAHPPGHCRSQVLLSVQVVLQPPVRQLSAHGCDVERQTSSQEL